MSHILPPIIFLQKNELFSWTYLLKKAPRRTKILTFSVWNKILKIWDILFKLIEIELQCSKNYFKICFITKSWSFWKQHKRHAPNWKNIFNIYKEYLLCLQSNASGSFFSKHVLILYNNDSHLLWQVFIWKYLLSHLLQKYIQS